MLLKYVSSLVSLVSFVSLVSVANAETPVGTIQVIIDLHDDVDVDIVNSVVMAEVGPSLRLNSIYSRKSQVYIADVESSSIEALFSILRGMSVVENVEVNSAVTAYAAPNDPLYIEQWNMAQVGGEKAWRSSRGEGAVVAVIDTGVAYSKHCTYGQLEDLSGTKFVKGYDFVNDTDAGCDDHGHGSHVAGTVAQSTNNGIGTVGLAPGASIMPIKVLDSNGGGTIADIADAIRFAADEGARTINLSLGGPMPSRVMGDAVAYAVKKGVVVVCAAGNDSSSELGYPAGYPNVVAVSASGKGDKRAFYSNYGPKVSVGAPGGDQQRGEKGGILQNTISTRHPTRGDVYAWFQGTSMAAPHVAAVSALLYSLGMDNSAAIIEVLQETAENPGGQDRTEDFGHGLVSAERAVEFADSGVLGGPRHTFLTLGLMLLCWPILGARRVFLGFKSLTLFGLGGVVGGSGLYVLDGTVVDSVPVLGTLITEPALMWDSMLVGTWLHGSLVWWSFAPPVFLLLLTLHMPYWRHWALGFAFGWLAHLLLAINLASVDLWGGFDRWWLVFSGAILAGFIVATVRAFPAEKEKVKPNLHVVGSDGLDDLDAL